MLVSSPAPAGWELCSTSKSATTVQAKAQHVRGRAAASHPRRGDTEGTRPLPPQAVSASLPALKTGSSGANRDIKEEIIDRKGILQCPSLGVYFPSCCHFSRPLLGSSLIPASPSPALIPSLPAHAVVLPFLSFSFSLPCFSFLRSPLLLAVFSHVENITSFYIFLHFILAAFCLCSLRPFSLSPLPSPYPFCSHPLLLIISPAAKWSIKPTRQSLPSSFLFMSPHSAMTCHTSTDTRTSVRKQTQRLHSNTEPHKSICVSVEAEYKTEQQRHWADK